MSSFPSPKINVLLIEMKDISEILISNHNLYKRDFLWRHTCDPYRIMIAEFMLHRTKANQVEPIYQQFLETYPDVNSLANANLDDVARYTQHLGLHWRAAHFIDACRFINMEYKGVYPQERRKLLKIPGVGEYVAGAILTVCFKKPEFVIDSNIARFINRYYGLELTGEIRRKKAIIEKAKILFNCKNPDKLLFSILDFTALVCKPRNPECSRCIFNDTCSFFNSKC